MTDPAQRKLFNTSMMTSARAMRALKRLESEKPYKRQLKLTPRDKVLPNPEFHMPDEDRMFDARYLNRCPKCNMSAVLQRKIGKRGKIWFRVKCDNHLKVVGCDNATEFFKSSAEAIRVWKMASILVQ